MNSQSIILDLCGGTGGWSRPYADAGYKVIIVDPIADSGEVQEFSPPQNVHGVLAAPPCTEFSVSGARWWAEKDRERPLLLSEALETLKHCYRIITEAQPKWWALENPVGRVTRWIGKPRWKFDPWEFGDPWQKRTCIWGDHVIPAKSPIKWPPNDERGMERWMRGPFILSPKPSRKQIETLVEWGMVPVDWESRFGSNPDRALLRSITPPKFAKAFAVANP